MVAICLTGGVWPHLGWSEITSHWVADIVAEQLAESTKTVARLSDSSAVLFQQPVPYVGFVGASPLIPS